MPLTQGHRTQKKAKKQDTGERNLLQLHLHPYVKGSETSYLSESLQAFGADFHPAELATLQDSGPLDIWFPSPLGADVRMADIVPELRPFATDFTSCHLFITFLLYFRDVIYHTITGDFRQTGEGARGGGIPRLREKVLAMAFITEEMPISYIMQKYPETREVFFSFGLACPNCLGALTGNLREGATMHGIDLEELVAALNQVVEEKRSRR